MKYDTTIYNKKPISINDPPLKRGNISIPVDKYLRKYDVPLPTNIFYTNFFFSDKGEMNDEGSYQINILPYLIRPNKDGIAICFPIKWFDATHVLSQYNLDFGLSSEYAMKRYVSHMDLLSVSLTWDNEDGKPDLEIPFVKGSPFISAKLYDGKPVFDTWNIILSINGVTRTGAKIKDNRFKVVMNNGQTWIVYFLNSKVTFYVEDDRQHINIMEESYTGYIRMALMYQDDQEQYLDDYRNNVLVGGDVSVDLLGENGLQVNQYKFTWKGVDINGNHVPNMDHLIMGLPHHESIITGFKKIAFSNSYDTIKGKMKGYIGSEWILTEKLTNIEWIAPRQIDPTKLQEVKNYLVSDLDLGKDMHEIDVYGFGKFASALGRLALIADELGEKEHAKYIRNRMIEYLNPWFQSNRTEHVLVYDISWGGLVTIESCDNAGNDYGNGRYNDHHFHYGYFIYAIAVVLKEYPNHPLKEKGKLLIRDIANWYGSDPYFPVSRHKDWFEGHSWAQGLDFLPDAKNQESTAESVNAYYGIMLFGKASGEKEIENWGRLLLAMEIRSTHTYWHIRNNNQIYPTPFQANKIVGVLWSTKVDYATFFGGFTEYVHCIQMIPFTPITEELLPKDYIEEEWDILAPALADGAINEEWKAYVIEDMAIVKKEEAWKMANDIGDTAFEKGNSRTNLMWWIATRY
jgi:endo-1,3(4)-beta-glucanase